MLIKQFLKLLFFLIFTSYAHAQNPCNFSVSGIILDEGNGDKLEFVNILLKEESRGTSSNQSGEFVLNNVCFGEFHLIISHVGCETISIFIEITQDTFLTIKMDHSSHVLGHFELTGQRLATSQQSATISQQAISDQSNKNLSTMLESITGIQVLRTGSGIAKPVIHGQYGNRISILNNGVTQSGQQWGNDHSPEIDPLLANRITIIKGVSAIEYMGSNLGSVVLVEPENIGKEPHVHGKFGYFYETNGRGNGLNFQSLQYSPIISWKVNASLKLAGDRKAPNYYLRNTGNREANFSIQLEKELSKNLKAELYYSSFNTVLGTLRGAQIGNLTDLQDAFTREVPFYTEENFSYSIDAPSQEVHHQFVKSKLKYFINDHTWFDFVGAFQFNNRAEFDIRRSGNTEIPSLKIEQYSYFGEGKYIAEIGNHTNIRTGVQFNFIDNSNDPSTGILPLIPAYFSSEVGSFFTGQYSKNHWMFEAGARFDYTNQLVSAISITLPREILRFNNNFYNYSASSGLKYDLKEHTSVAYHVGLKTRNPAINELYSNGLHQGVSGIEEGNLLLNSELSFKNTLALETRIKDRIHFDLLFYYQHIQDYIFLSPTDEIRLTIRGAFPVFQYEQTNASIYGLDYSTFWEINDYFHAQLNYSYIRGTDLTNNIPLIFIPSNNINLNFTYKAPKTIELASKKLENFEISIGNRYVFRQNNLLSEQDFLPVPEAYYLLGLKSSFDMNLGKTRLRWFGQVDNLLNNSYRDYLNRQRYFADEMGINFMTGVTVKF